MTPAVLPLLLMAQAAPAATPVPVQEPTAADAAQADDIVVRAKVGHVVLVFDKGDDGRLHNCRVFRSSGVDKIDAKACRDLPDCVTSEKGKQFCGDAVPEKPVLASISAPRPEKPDLSIGKLIKPEKPKTPAVGPVGQVAVNDGSDAPLVKLPPLPKDTTHSAPIVLTGAAQNQSDSDTDNVLHRNDGPDF